MAPRAKTTQGFVPIEEIRDGVVVLKNGTLVMILLVSSLNFALKSADEQRAIIGQFQNFLNSLDFSVQIHVQSRRLDIRPYLATVEARLNQEVNELLKIQIKEYVTFVRNFTDSTNIMTKQFFVVVPYEPAIVNTSGGASGILGRLFKRNSGLDRELKNKTFEENRSQLEQRASVVSQGLSGSGLRVLSLGTDELVELYYRIFNPGELEQQAH